MGVISCRAVVLIVQGAERLTTDLISGLVGKERVRRFYSLRVSFKHNPPGVACCCGIAACCNACIRTELQARMLSDVMHCTESVSHAVQTVEAISEELQSQHARAVQQLRRFAS